jgi:hypothetical protein
VDFKKLDAIMKNDTYILHFMKEVLEMVASHEVYSLFGGFFDYHQIMITPKDKYMTSFITNWGAFVWLVMAFGLKNNSINIPKVGKFGFFIINFGMFMKIFLYMILMF